MVQISNAKGRESVWLGVGVYADVAIVRVIETEKQGCVGYGVHELSHG